MRRLKLIPTAVLLGLCLAVLPACKNKKPAEGDTPAPEPGGPGPVPAAVSSDHLLFAQVNVKEIRTGAIVTEVKEALTKAGGTDLWNKFDQEAEQEIGLKLSDIDSVTACVPELPTEDRPPFIVIVTAAGPIGRTKTFGYKLPAAPDARGLYPAGTVFVPSPPGSKKAPTTRTESYVHFPDDKTAVLVHTDLAQKYLDGYAKNRSGWPMSADLTRAAAGHTVFVTANMQKVPAKALGKGAGEQFGPLLTAQAVTLTLDLKGKELTATGRARFPDAATAGKARDTLQGLIGMVAGQVDQAIREQQSDADGPLALGSIKPAVDEAQRAMKGVKVEVSGSDVTLSARYKADFDIAKLIADGVKQAQESAPRLTAQNNLRQIGIALHNHNDAVGWIPIPGIGPKGAALKNAAEKPLLSWRVALLPYVEQQALYNEFKLDEPWDSEHNKKLIEKMPKLYAPVAKPGKPGYTHMQMVVGPSALQPPVARIPFSFPDGTANTIAVVEAAEPVIWTKPDDVMFPDKELPKDFRKKFGGQFPGGFNVALWDGSVRFIPDSMSDRTLTLALNPSDGQVLPAEWNPKPPGKFKR
jgi:hypothetical protein